jgi:hypothetical protein
VILAPRIFLLVNTVSTQRILPTPGIVKRDSLICATVTHIDSLQRLAKAARGKVYLRDRSIAVPTCTKSRATEFTHQDKEFGGLMTRIIFCSSCSAVIRVVIAI